jgi:PAS domain S-box-containing protein
VLQSANINPFAPMDFVILTMNFSALVYVIALFGFRIFDPIPMARRTVIEQMQEGMLVLDMERRIVDLNPTAEKILGSPAARIKGQTIGQVFHEQFADPMTTPAHRDASQSEVTLTIADTTRIYSVLLSLLNDARGFALGYLILLHDVTEQKRTQARLLEQQRMVATLEERERLARELHDSVGQVLGYVSMQAQAVRKWVHDGEAAVAEAELTRLADVAQEAHAVIRESILSLKTGSAPEWSFLAALKQYFDAFRDHYGIHTELTIPPGLGEQAFEPGVGVQLLRVIQEALTNARKHGRAHRVQVTFERRDSQARIVVADDGCGFDPDRLSASAGDHWGLAFMRERMARIGGSLTIHSQPGAGTQAVLLVPIRDA